MIALSDTHVVSPTDPTTELLTKTGCVVVISGDVSTLWMWIYGLIILSETGTSCITLGVCPPSDALGPLLFRISCRGLDSTAEIHDKRCSSVILSRIWYTDCWASHGYESGLAALTAHHVSRWCVLTLSRRKFQHNFAIGTLFYVILLLVTVAAVLCINIAPVRSTLQMLYAAC